MTSSDLGTFVQIVRRRGFAVAAFVTLCLGLAIAGIAVVTPLFEATAVVLIGQRERQVVDMGRVVEPLEKTPEMVETELHVLGSRHLMRSVVDRLRLDALQEFNPALQPPSQLDRVLHDITTALANFVPVLEPMFANLSRGGAAPRAADIVDEVQNRLSITRQGKSRILAVTFRSADPVLAAAVPNALAEAYVEEQAASKDRGTQEANLWLRAQLDTLRDEVGAADEAVEAFRRSSGMVQGRTVSLVQEQISAASDSLMAAQNARAVAEAKLAELNRTVDSGDPVDSLSEVLASPLIQRLHEQEAELQRREQELLQSNGKLHPAVIAVRAELVGLESRIRAEMKKIETSLRSQVRVAEDQEALLRAQLATFKSDAEIINLATVKLHALEADAQASRTVYERFLARNKEMLAAPPSDADATIVSLADQPSKAAVPNVPLVLALTLLLSGSAGLLGAFLAEQADDGFRSRVQLEQDLGAPTVGPIPLARRRASRWWRRRPTSVDTRSTFGEALTSAYGKLTAGQLRIAGRQTPASVVVVASSNPGEGKTTVTISLAQLVARNGQRVILVDCDLRRPRVHAMAGMSMAPGLSNLLDGSASLTQVLRKDTATGITCITAGSATENPTDRIGSPEFRRMLGELQMMCDVIIIDTPPVSVSIDALILAALADHTLFLVRWGATRRQTVALMYRELAEAAKTTPVAALSMVNARKNARYRFGDSGQYYGSTQKFYR
ncbi:polysaccharide biosynthesis tyrosine autokinase [Skermanella mucosa]|uniref:GumC family protein n=1 Tax=Skermanella mucosa TaxID=1789672 RepID=UPI00192B9EDB|nr:polysaccharide biosynthesis tyrosine autokinase [Skermanella mucosa]UEM18695.1 polysaccharide biosynthesis tyrosine autokinase [Skermanella mucosa]